MALLLTVKRKETPGPSICINCPRCGEQGIAGQSFEWLETLRLLGLIPLLKARSTFVQCSGCKTMLTSMLDIGELAKYQSTGVSQFLSDEVSFVYKFLAIVSLFLFYMPIVGLVLAGITVLGTFRSHTWPRTVGIISLVLSSILTVFLVIVGICVECL
jgi:hypothetical protein